MTTKSWLAAAEVAVERAAARREARLARQPITTIEEAISLMDAASEEGAGRRSSTPSGTARCRRSRLRSKMRSRAELALRGCRSQARSWTSCGPRTRV
jgi:hypothetical protein